MSGDTETTDRVALLEGQYADLATITIKIWEVKRSKPCKRYGAIHSAEEGCLDAIPEAAVKGGAASVQVRY